MRHDGRKNLVPFKAGKDERRNTKGRPPKLPGLDDLLAETLGEEDDKGKTAAKYILLTLRNKALKGDTRAIEILFERAYGKAKQFVDVTTQGEKITKLITEVEIIKTVRNDDDSTNQAEGINEPGISDPEV